MSAPQSSTPYSLRIPTKLSQMIDQIARKIGKPAPDAVRAGIEAAFANEYRILALDAANADRAGSIRILRGAVAEASANTQLPLPVYSALMYFLHWAYLHAGPTGFANPKYSTAMLDIVFALIDLGKSMNFTMEHAARSSLGITEGETLADGIRRIKKEIANGLGMTYAEMIARPLESMADDLQYLNSDEVARIFAPHLKTLLPVAVLGAKMGIDEGIVQRDMDALCPEGINFQIGPMHWGLQGKSMALVVSEGHHTNVFGSQAVMSLYTAIECNALEDVLANNEESHFFTRGEFQLNRIRDHVQMHTNSGYRLGLTVTEARDLVSNLTRAFTNPSWRNLVSRYRELKGDL